jgi:hypothetical protein
MKEYEYFNAKYVVENPEAYNSRDVKLAMGEVDKWEFANQRVIEELEKLQIHHKGEHFGCGRVYFIKEDSIDGRIKELKQE